MGVSAPQPSVGPALALALSPERPCRQAVRLRAGAARWLRRAPWLRHA